MTPSDNPPEKAVCDHEWEFVDDSFDHEYGCERVHYMRCAKCEAVKECENDSPEIDLT